MSSFWERKMGDLTPASLPEKPIETRTWTTAVPQNRAALEPRQAAPLTSSKAQSSRDNSRCPECDSSNYMRPGVSAQLAHRCYDCGYPIRQSTSGVSAPSAPSSPAQPARQLDSVLNAGYQPHVIIDHIG